MYAKVRDLIVKELDGVKGAGLYKTERLIFTPQRPNIRVEQGEVLNFCANNYLGLCDKKELIEAAMEGLKTHGYGMSSVRFICGTQDIHRQLERKISEFLGTDDTILYSSCFDANGGLFETLIGEPDVVISDELNHASIIDGIRLCKAQRKRFKHGDMADLERNLKEAKSARIRLIATDGVFSMDGDVADLKAICDLADEYDSLVMIDDSHATGFIGDHGRGTAEWCGVEGRVDIITSTLGKALGGASGGFTSGRGEIIELLRQRSRPYIFSNTLAPPIVAAATVAINLLQRAEDLRRRLRENTIYFRREISAKGFRIKEGSTPIIPIMVGDPKLAQKMATDLLGEGIYAIAFSYPVVPRGQDRIRVQISAAHTREHLDRAVEAFAKVGKRLGII